MEGKSSGEGVLLDIREIKLCVKIVVNTICVGPCVCVCVCVCMCYWVHVCVAWCSGCVLGSGPAVLS